MTTILARDQNGQMVVADSSEARAYGWTQVNASGQPVQQSQPAGTFSNPVGGTIEQNVARDAIEESQRTGQPADSTGTMQTIGSEPYSYGVKTSSALAENIKDRFYKTENGVRSEISREEYEAAQAANQVTQTSGQLQPDEPRTFKTQSGQEFIATPIGSSAQGGLLWSTPYGEVRSEPQDLEKNIERQMLANSLYERDKAQFSQDMIINERADRWETALAKNIYGWGDLSTPRDLISMTISPMLGISRERMQFEILQQRRAWVKTQMDLGPAASIGLNSAFLGGQYVLLTAGGPIFSALGSKAAAISPIAKSAMTGAEIGLFSGLMTIGSVEAIEGYKMTLQGDPQGVQKFVGGGMIGAIGAYGNKAVWERSVVPELKTTFPQAWTTKPVTGEISLSQIMIREDSSGTFSGSGQGMMVTRTPFKPDVASHAEFTFKGITFNKGATIEMTDATLESKAIMKDVMGGYYPMDLGSRRIISAGGSMPTIKEGLFARAFKSFSGGDDIVGAGFSQKLPAGNEFTQVFKSLSIDENYAKIASYDAILDTTKMPGATGGSSMFSTGSSGSGTSMLSSFDDAASIAKEIQKSLTDMQAGVVNDIIGSTKSADPILSNVPIFQEESLKSDSINLASFDITEMKQTDIERGHPGAVLDMVSPNIEDFEDLSIGPITTGSSISITKQIQDPVITEISTALEVPGIDTPSAPGSDIFEIPAEIPPIIPPFFDFQQGGSDLIGFDSGFSRRNFEATPSWSAVEFDITGPSAGSSVTGLELRPMEERRSRKRRRRK